jgi:hypothetical protein
MECITSDFLDVIWASSQPNKLNEHVLSNVLTTQSNMKFAYAKYSDCFTQNFKQEHCSATMILVVVCCELFINIL